MFVNITPLSRANLHSSGRHVCSDTDDNRTESWEECRQDTEERQEFVNVTKSR